MSLSDELAQINTAFIDTAPIIYYIEAHPQFGPLAREVVNAFQSGKVTAFSSVITLAEVLPKPIEVKNERLVRKFIEFLTYGKNLSLVEISMDIAERAGRLRGRYPDIKALDAIHPNSGPKFRGHHIHFLKTRLHIPYHLVTARIARVAVPVYPHHHWVSGPRSRIERQEKKRRAYFIYK